MKLNEVVKELIKKSGYSQRGYAAAKGLPLGTVQKACINQNCKTDTLMRVVGPLGYAVAVVPRGSKLPDGGYVLSMSDPVDPDAPIDDRRTGSHVRIHGGDSDELIG